MSEAITLNYRLTKDLWQQFFNAHYGCDISLRFRFVWGVFCIVIACLGFGGFYDNPLVAVLLMATGFFGVLSRHLLVVRSLRTAARHPFYGAELEVAISPEEIAVRSGGEGDRRPWSSFVGYRSLKPGFLFYYDRNAFFFIPRNALNEMQSQGLMRILGAAHIPDLARAEPKKPQGV